MRPRALVAAVRRLPSRPPADEAARRFRPRWASLRRLSLRSRMALLVGFAVAAGVLAVALASLIATRSTLRSSIDSQLTQQARQTVASARTIFLSGRPTVQFVQTPGLPLQGILAGSGTVVRGNGDLTDPLPVDAADLAVANGTSDLHLRSVDVDGMHLRIATVPVPGLGALQVGRPISDVDHTLQALVKILAVTGTLGVLGAVLLGFGVARAGLRPVDEAADAAEEVARTQDLSALIPVRGSDEVARLAGSLNSMLQALDASRQRQRQLVDDASHELRTPLTSLRTNVELLLRAEASPGRLSAPDRAALLHDVDAQMREMSGLVTELVDLARDEARPEQAVDLDLAVVVDAAVERVRRRANARDIRLTSDVRSAPLRGRAHALERAVLNLLDNAVKFGPAGSEVRVVAGPGPAGSGQAAVTVTDQGPGIDPADRGQVFDRFYRSASARGLPGSGLGLAIVADAAHDHGGTVEIGDAPGGGALFVMLLAAGIPPAGPPALTRALTAPAEPPAADRSPWEPAPAPAPAPASSGGSRTGR